MGRGSKCGQQEQVELLKEALERKYQRLKTARTVIEETEVGGSAAKIAVGQTLPGGGETGKGGALSSVPAGGRR